MDAQIGLRCSQVALLLLEGDVVAAEERAREGVTISARSDFSRGRIKALSRLAEVLRVTDRLVTIGSSLSARPRRVMAEAARANREDVFVPSHAATFYSVA